MATRQKRNGAASPSPYTMKLSLSVLDHLGLNLYSSLPAVLSEVVANSWDADATKVEISIDTEGSEIVVVDNGEGMDRNAINDRYLTIGYQRRKSQGRRTKRLKRPVMGRKGIGKLSLFSIANEIELWSLARDGPGKLQPCGIIMRAEDIRAQISADPNAVYHPEPVDPSRITIRKGTRIVLRDLRVRPTLLTETSLRTRLARRFSVLGKKFDLILNGKSIGIPDRAYFKKLEYIWTIGKNKTDYSALAPAAKKTIELSGIVNRHKGWTVSGWLGTFDEQASVKADEGNNTVPILARGKLVHEDILKDLDEGGLFTKYLIGEIEARFLDVDNKPDMATSDRQHLKEDDERYRALRDFVQKKLLREVGNRWRDWRNEDSVDKATKGNPIIEQWYTRLNPDEKKYAQALFGKIGTVPVADPEQRREVYRNAILAFERLRLRNRLNQINDLPDTADFSVLQPIFLGIDEIEAVEYHIIVEGRMEIIQRFQKLVPVSKEKAIQQFLFGHLWLMDPSWERAAVPDSHVEKSAMKAFAKITKVELTPEERKGRIDIAIRTWANKYVIIELKKASVRPDFYRLQGQMSKYRSALVKCLEANGESNPQIEVVAVIGEPLGEPSREEQERVLSAIDGTVLTYDALISGARHRYEEYITADQRVSELRDLLEKL